MVLTRPFDDYMNHGNFALCSVDFERFGWDEVEKIMLELNDLKISGFAVSIKDEKEPVHILNQLDEDIQFRGRIKSTCILGRPYLNSQNYGKSNQCVC